MQKIPLMIISDAPTAGTGLARITRELATRIAIELPDLYRVCTFGYGGPPSRALPFFQYIAEGVRPDWVLPTLPQVWDDWAGGEKGVALPIWDCSRLGWLVAPQFQEEILQPYPGLGKWISGFLQKNEVWLYCPVDSEGPNDKLTFPVGQTLFGITRILAYTAWGSDVIRRTIGDGEADKRYLTALPHGIDGEVFYELPRQACRKAFFTRTGAGSPLGKRPEPIADDEVLVGIVATNQSRKSFPLGIEAAAILARDRKLRLWIHTDALERNWSIPALLIDYGMIEKAVISLGQISDDNMAVAYSACDLTFGIGPEGFGFPLCESVFCGTACITGSYAANGEVLSAYPDFLVPPRAFRLEGEYAAKRPVYSAEDFASAARNVIGKRTNRPSEYDWENVWPRWKAYLQEAANGK